MNINGREMSVSQAKTLIHFREHVDDNLVRDALCVIDYAVQETKHRLMRLEQYQISFREALENEYPAAKRKA